MTSSSYRALVVDDEPAIRHATARALLEEGFTCDHAADGKIALQQIDANGYDVIITDLKMPEMNGHALAVNLLNRARSRAKIVIQTGIIEPRLARDLFARGVDDIVYKPCDQRLLAMRVKRMVDADRSRSNGGNGQAKMPRVVQDQARSSSRLEITMQDIDRKLTHVSEVLPVSQAAIDVFQMASSDDSNARDIGQAIQRDAALTVEVLRIANTAHYNPAGKKISSLEEAVTRIGQRQIAELAIATNALAAVTSATLPWLDVDLTWRRSLAAGVAAELLVEQGGHGRIEQGLILCAIMHPVGRVVVGSIYPELYPALIEECKQNNSSLLVQEAQVLPSNHARIMSKLLKLWNIPLDVYLPLAFLLDDGAAVARLGEPMRTRVELIRCATAVASIAVGRWQPWDVVECPAGQMLQRLNVRAVAPIIEQTRERTEQLLKLREESEETGDAASTEPAPANQLRYVGFADEGVDLFQHMLFSFGMQPMRTAQPAGSNPDVVNALDLPPESAKTIFTDLGECKVLIAERNQPLPTPTDGCTVLQLPISHAAFLEGIEIGA